VLLVDDHDLVRAAVERLLDMVPEIEVVGSAGGGVPALRLVPCVRPDVVLMDLSMPEMDGVQATRAIVAAFPAVRVVAFSAYSEPELVADAFQAGVTGYVLKGGDADELLEAVQAAARSESWLSPRVAEALGAICGDEQRRAQKCIPPGRRVDRHSRGQRGERGGGGPEMRRW
jgi:DNA-binding NarL/FixJ family response regulator